MVEKVEEHLTATRHRRVCTLDSPCFHDYKLTRGCGIQRCAAPRASCVDARTRGRRSGFWRRGRRGAGGFPPRTGRSSRSCLSLSLSGLSFSGRGTRADLAAHMRTTLADQAKALAGRRVGWHQGTSLLTRIPLFMPIYSQYIYIGHQPPRLFMPSAPTPPSTTRRSNHAARQPATVGGNNDVQGVDDAREPDQEGQQQVLLGARGKGRCGWLRWIV